MICVWSMIYYLQYTNILIGGGCWFCPNSNTQEFIHIKKNHPELWAELRKLAQDPDTISDMFRRNKTFWEIDEILDQKIKEQSH